MYWPHLFWQIFKNDTVALIQRDMSTEDIEKAALLSSNITGMFVNRGISRTELEDS